MKKIIFSLLLIINYSLLIIHSATAQPTFPADRDTSRLRISLLTCTPGEELYSSFGHSAFRVIDSNSVTDIVYNYGTFNFDDEGFYIKFVRGKLLYYVSTEYFIDFKNIYESENRGITEQVLLLSASERIAVNQFLNENIKAENRFYKYDFFFDNCTTRLRDILKKQHDSIFCQKPVMPAGTTFRQAIHQYLDHNGQQWSELGIDILMGRRCDAIMTPSQMQSPDLLLVTEQDEVIGTAEKMQVQKMVQKRLGLAAIPKPADAADAAALALCYIAMAPLQRSIKSALKVRKSA